MVNTRLSPLLETDQEYGITLAVLMDCISDYAFKPRKTLNALAQEGGTE